MESIRKLLKKAAGLLLECKLSDTPILDAELLLVHVLNESGVSFDRLKLLTHHEYPVDINTAGRYLELIALRCKGKPVQYITNRQEFMGLEFYVEPGVLIPRADTEIVVEKVIELTKEIEKPNIIDMCTGSGAIAVSLAVNIPNARVWAVDISDCALNCCNINVGRFGLESRVSIIKSDLFENIKEEGLIGCIDVIVSNPPYIESEAIRELPANVRDYEPHFALDGGKDGLVYYRRIIKDSVGLLTDNGILAFETGFDQGDKVKNIMKESGCYDNLNIEKDLSGYDRCVWGHRILHGE